jgi:hypothetical protein
VAGVMILSSWPLVGWWWITGDHERGWHRHRLIGAALVEATTGAGQKPSTTRYVTGLRLDADRAELCEGGYYVCELDTWPRCQCERPRTSSHDPTFCQFDAAIVPQPQPTAGKRGGKVPLRPMPPSAVDLWIIDHPEVLD